MPKRTVKVETITPYKVSGYPVPGSVRFRDELQEAVDLCGSLCDGDPEVQSHFWGEGGKSLLRGRCLVLDGRGRGRG